MLFLHNNPFFRMLLPLVAGIVFARFVPGLELLSPIFFIIAVVVFFGLHIRQKTEILWHFRWIFGVSLHLFLFATGYFIAEQKVLKSAFSHLNQKGIYAVELTEAPVEKKNSLLCRVKLISFTDSLQKPQPAFGKAILYIARDSATATLSSGQRLLIETRFTTPDGEVNPDAFNYAAYLKRQGIGATAYISSERWTVYGQNTNFSFLRMAEEAQKKLLNIYSRFGIKGDEFAVLAALTLGSKDALHPELRQNYTTSGGMHILAVSGLHVGIIYMVLMFLFRSMNRNRRLKVLKTVFVITFLWIYAFVTGLPPSVMRATLMFSLVAIGASFERKPRIYNTISAAAFVMLIINPDFLYEVGFQLSFSAVVSIIYYQPKIAGLFVIKNKPLKWAWNLTSVSLAAQIGTAPFSLYYFNQFPNYFLITNFVAIPFATFIIYTAVALFAVSSIPLISNAIALILHWLLYILNYSIETIQSLPFSLTVTSINFLQLSAVFGFIILFTVFLYKKKFAPLFVSLVLLLVWSGINLQKNIAKRDFTRLLVFSDNSATHITFIKKGNSYFFTTDSASCKRITQNYFLNNKIDLKMNAADAPWYKEGFAEFEGKKFLILTDDRFRRKTTENPIKVDFLIIGNKLKPRINDILNCVIPDCIIVDRTISEWYTRSIRKACAEKNITFYAIAEEGTFQLNMNSQAKP